MKSRRWSNNGRPRLRLLLPLGLAVVGMCLVTLAVAASPAWYAAGDDSPRATVPEPPAYSISGVVFHDLDGDGAYAEGGSEPGIGGVVVTLDPGGHTYVSNETDEWGPVGGYWFPDLVPGQEYTVTCAAVPGYVGTSPDQVTGVVLPEGGTVPGGTIPGSDYEVIHFGKALSATVEVQLELQGRPARPDASWSVPVTYTISGAATNESAVSDAYGRFVIPSVPEGIRDISVKNMHTLSTLMAETQIVSPTTAITMTLYEGDANDDDVISSADVAVLSSGYWRAEPEPEFEPGANFNEDSYIDARDASLLGANYFESGPMAQVSPLAQTPALRFDPASAEASVGDIIDVTVAIESGGTKVQAADLFVGYDPSVLQVVDENGVPATEVLPVTDALGTVLRNQVDAANGVVSYASLSTSDYTPGTLVDVMQIRFRAIGATDGDGTVIEMLDDLSTRRITRLCVDGYDVLRNRYDAVISIEGYPPIMWLPYIVRND